MSTPTNSLPHLAVSATAFSPAQVLPLELVLCIITLCINVNPRVALTILHFCAKWRRGLLGSPLLCNRVAFSFKTPEAILYFLSFTRDVPQELLFDKLAQRRDISPRNRARLILNIALTKDTLLMKATHIQSLITAIPDIMWFTRLKSIGTFMNLKRLEIFIFMRNSILPATLVAPNLTYLFVAATEGRCTVPMSKVIKVMSAYPLRKLILEHITIEDNLDAHYTVSLPYLRLIKLDPTSLTTVHAALKLMDRISHKIRFSTSVYGDEAPLLSSCWRFLSLRKCTRLHVIVSPYEHKEIHGVQLIVYDPEVRHNPSTVPITLGRVFDADQGYVLKRYTEADIHSGDFSRDTMLYRKAIQSVEFRSYCTYKGRPTNVFYEMGHNLLPPLLTWLKSLRPTHMFLDARPIDLIAQAPEYLRCWPALQHITIHVGEYTNVITSDDHDALQAVQSWTGMPELPVLSLVTLVGIKFRDPKLRLDTRKLRSKIHVDDKREIY